MSEPDGGDLTSLREGDRVAFEVEDEYSGTVVAYRRQKCEIEEIGFMQSGYVIVRLDFDGDRERATDPEFDRISLTSEEVGPYSWDPVKALFYDSDSGETEEIGEVVSVERLS